MLCVTDAACLPCAVDRQRAAASLLRLELGGVELRLVVLQQGSFNRM